MSERTYEIDADITAAGKDLRLIPRLGSQTYDIDLRAAAAARTPPGAPPTAGERDRQEDCANIICCLRGEPLRGGLV